MKPPQIEVEIDDLRIIGMYKSTEKLTQDYIALYIYINVLITGYFDTTLPCCDMH